MYNFFLNESFLFIEHELKVAEEFWDFLGGEGVYLDTGDMPANC
jgi:hypothetical protein